MKRALVAFTFIAGAIGAHEEHSYRDFSDEAPVHVQEFYKTNHACQTLAFVLEKKAEYLPPRRVEMGVWEAFERLEDLVDASDPDLDLPQIYHAYQTAEAMRRNGEPRWMILTGFIHDLGKILETFGEPLWAVVGDTFPTGCAFSEKIVFHSYFKANPDWNDYPSKYGIYSPGCGLDSLQMSWGHDEYLYQVVKDYLPREAAFIIRYHSFYALHREEAYTYFLNKKDRELLPWLKKFSEYDLYSKENRELDLETLRPYYENLVKEFLPQKLRW
jgi:inositol oxygenase